MGRPPVKVGVVDIGTNSMRLLITDGADDGDRSVDVTGLGVGVDSSGILSDEAMDRSLDVLVRYGSAMDDGGVERRLVIATSAARDAANREQFFDRAESALGVRPTLVSGEQEARFAFEGATRELGSSAGVLVSDIGGGSTEFVTDLSSRSVDIGSVRLTDRYLPDRPPDQSQLANAVDHLADLIADLDHGSVGSHIGVAGTWTSIAAIARDLPRYDRSKVHGFVLTNTDLDRVADRLRPLTVAETAEIPSLDPKRAPVILAGVIIATMITEILGVDQTMVSERDTLDGAAMTLLALP